MNKADELQTLFQDFRPDLSSNRLFMEKLSRKLDAVEYIKQVQDWGRYVGINMLCWWLSLQGESVVPY